MTGLDFISTSMKIPGTVSAMLMTSALINWQLQLHNVSSGLPRGLETVLNGGSEVQWGKPKEGI